MKATFNPRKWLILIGLTIGLANLVFTPSTVTAQPKGGERLMQLSQVKTAEDLQKIEPGDMLVMSCPKCKQSWVTVVDKTPKAGHPAESKTIPVDLCSSCDSKIVTKGFGKNAKDVLVHTCKTCGSKDVFCCVMKKGGAPTQGMAAPENK